MALYLRRVLTISQRCTKILNQNLCQASFTRPQKVLTVKMSKIKPTKGVRLYSSEPSLDLQFSESQKRVTSLSSEPDNDMKLKLYALFKQSTVGKCNTKKPGALDFVGRAKWQAWDTLQGLSQAEAKQQYVTMVGQLVAAEGGSAASVEGAEMTGTNTEIPGLLVEKKKGYLQVTFNRPDKRNAITSEMYVGVQKILADYANDDSIGFVVFTGQGDFYCSGNDLGNFAKFLSMNMSMPEMAQAAGTMLREYISSYIEFPKPLVAVINGPAVGIAVTVLGLFDIIYSTDRATFQTPFSSLGQSPEGCSSYTFPKLMGYAQANEILMLNKKITALEAKQLRLVSDVFPHESFKQEVEKRITEMASLPMLSLRYVRRETKSTEIEMLRKLNVLECELLVERWQSQDCQKAIASFFKRKSNL